MKQSQIINQTSHSKEACNAGCSACVGSRLQKDPSPPQCTPVGSSFLFDRDFNTNRKELCSLLEELCAIPAPSGQEDLRAAFISQWLSHLGLNPVIDEAKNVPVSYTHLDVYKRQA